MNSSRRSGRRIALAVTALAVSGMSVGIAVAGTASAAGTGTCTDNVKVRSEPSKTAPVVGSCEKGQTTRVGETRNGFVQLEEFGGWASAKYVKSGSSSSEGRTAPNRAGDADERQSPSSSGQSPSSSGQGGSERGTADGGTSGRGTTDEGTGHSAGGLGGLTG